MQVFVLYSQYNIDLELKVRFIHTQWRWQHHHFCSVIYGINADQRGTFRSVAHIPFQHDTVSDSTESVAHPNTTTAGQTLSCRRCVWCATAVP